MPVVLPRVYPITPESLRGQALFAWIEALLSGSCRFFQYRRKSGGDAEKLQELKIVLALARERGARVIVDDRPDLCLLAGADGVHLGQEDLPVDEVRRLLPAGSIIGLSTHNLDQIEEAEGLPADYFALGPVFATASKENPSPLVPDAVQEEALKRSAKPVVAIGGISPAGVRELFARGFASVAVISFTEREPATAFEALMAEAP